MSTQNREFFQNMGPIGREASRCIRCGFCNAACPTSNVKSAFKDSRTSRGRLILLQSLQENSAQIDPYAPNFKELIDLCYSCRRCVDVCPAGIPIPDLMSFARHAYLQRNGQHTLTLGHRIYANYGTWDRLGSSTAPVSNWMVRQRLVRHLMEYLTHIDSRALLPRFSKQSFTSWFKAQPRSTVSMKEIVYFVDSYANYNDPSIGKSVVNLLSKLGYQVNLPTQRESGMPAIEFGLMDKARELARYNLDQLLPYVKRGVRVVCSSPAATYLLRKGYGELLQGQDVDMVSDAVVDVAEILLEGYHDGMVRFSADSKHQVQYHYCCLSRTLSLGSTTCKLLCEAGIEYNMVEDCCGGAGVWGTFKENYDLSSEIAKKLGNHMKPDIPVLTESETCRLQIESHVQNQVQFPIELLSHRVIVGESISA